jgi:hypothetical protein
MASFIASPKNSLKRFSALPHPTRPDRDRQRPGVDSKPPRRRIAAWSRSWGAKRLPAPGVVPAVADAVMNAARAPVKPLPLLRMLGLEQRRLPVHQPRP